MDAISKASNFFNKVVDYVPFDYMYAPIGGVKLPPKVKQAAKSQKTRSMSNLDRLKEAQQRDRVLLEEKEAKEQSQLPEFQDEAEEMLFRRHKYLEEQRIAREKKALRKAKHIERVNKNAAKKEEKSENGADKQEEAQPVVEKKEEEVAEPPVEEEKAPKSKKRDRATQEEAEKQEASVEVASETVDEEQKSREKEERKQKKKEKKEEKRRRKEAEAQKE